MLRNIKGIFSTQKVNMGGIILDQALPIAELEQLDPFLLIHHWDRSLKGNQKQNETGVGPHPHRGFSPVTFIYKGAVHHRDSRGNSSIVKAGGAQWMNSGMSIIHSERPDAKLAEEGGEFEIIQFWVNTPAEFKMKEPEYFPLNQEDIPEIASNDGKIKLGIVAGSLHGVKSDLKAYSKLLICKISAEKGGAIILDVPEEYNALLYILDGNLLLNNSFSGKAKNLIWFKNSGNEISIACNENSRAILLAGKPIGEKVTSSGPFVMNTHNEIMTAVRDFQMGKMGVLIEEF